MTSSIFSRLSTDGQAIAQRISRRAYQLVEDGQAMLQTDIPAVYKLWVTLTAGMSEADIYELACTEELLAFPEAFLLAQAFYDESWGKALTAYPFNLLHSATTIFHIPADDSNSTAPALESQKNQDEQSVALPEIGIGPMPEAQTLQHSGKLMAAAVPGTKEKAEGSPAETASVHRAPTPSTTRSPIIHVESNSNGAHCGSSNTPLPIAPSPLPSAPLNNIPASSEKELLSDLPSPDTPLATSLLDVSDIQEEGSFPRNQPGALVNSGDADTRRIPPFEPTWAIIPSVPFPAKPKYGFPYQVIRDYCGLPEYGIKNRKFKHRKPEVVEALRENLQNGILMIFEPPCPRCVQRGPQWIASCIGLTSNPNTHCFNCTILNGALCIPGDSAAVVTTGAVDDRCVAERKRPRRIKSPAFVAPATNPTSKSPLTSVAGVSVRQYTHRVRKGMSRTVFPNAHSAYHASGSHEIVNTFVPRIPSTVDKLDRVLHHLAALTEVISDMRDDATEAHITANRVDEEDVYDSEEELPRKRSKFL